MKNELSLLLIICSLGTGVHAQSVRYGFKAGGSLTRFTGSGTPLTGSSDLKPGFHGGAVANVSVNDRLAIQPEVLFSMKGQQYDLLGATVKETLNYIDVPVLLKLSTQGFFLEAGPQLGLLVSETNTGSKKVEAGYAAGLGYQLESGLNLGLRYNGGISKVYTVEYRDANNLPAGTYSPRNQAFQLYVGYLLPN
ncbi:porin family protein [Hymenobacter terrenus]|uniref:porin family protein n=1 Tax=Hymenobacter terrenus TaxID=1629124 RepID=UPI000619694D|nr:porin family protein [Hymenobacter terrenus]